MASQHEALVDQVLLELGSRPDIRCWPTRPGKYRHLYRNEVITIGPPGIADVIGIRAPSGLFFAVEVKVGRDKQRDSQSAFERMVVSLGGIYVAARSVEEAVRGIYAK